MDHDHFSRGWGCNVVHVNVTVGMVVNGGMVVNVGMVVMVVVGHVVS